MAIEKYNMTELVNATNVLDIIKELNTDYTGGFFILMALIAFFIILMSNFSFEGAKVGFLVTSFLVSSTTGLFWLAGLAPSNIMVASLLFVFLSVLLYFLVGDNGGY